MREILIPPVKYGVESCEFSMRLLINCSFSRKNPEQPLFEFDGFSSSEFFIVLIVGIQLLIIISLGLSPPLHRYSSGAGCALSSSM